MRVFWTNAALGQLGAIHTYISKTSPEYAQRIVDQLTRRSVQIAAFPFSGRMVPEYGLKEIREVIEGSYRVIYLVKEDNNQIDVLAVIHHSREISNS